MLDVIISSCDSCSYVMPIELSSVLHESQLLLSLQCVAVLSVLHPTQIFEDRGQNGDVIFPML